MEARENPEDEAQYPWPDLTQTFKIRYHKAQITRYRGCFHWFLKLGTIANCVNSNQQLLLSHAVNIPNYPTNQAIECCGIYSYLATLLSSC